MFVYVIAWVAVVFGINCASNVGRKLVIVRGGAEHYYCFLPTLREQLIPNAMANHAIYYNMFFLSHVIASDNLLGVCQQIRCITVFLASKVTNKCCSIPIG